MTQPVTELDESVYAAHEAQLDQAEAGQFDDFDAFWRDQANAVRPAKIRGVIVRPPIDVPMGLMQQIDTVMGSDDEQSLHQVTAQIFGRDILSTWIAAGMGVREFQTVIAWAGAAMRGTPVDFAEAVRIVAEAIEQAEREAAEGKAGTRAERRAAKGGPKKSAKPGR